MLFINTQMLDTLITSKTRIRLLVKFFVNAANAGYLRGLAQEMNENTNAIRKELNNLSDAGYIIREEIDAKIMYRANTAHPLFLILQQLVRKYIGIDSIVEQVVQRMGGVSRIFLIGDYAKGVDSGKIEIVVEGMYINEEYLTQLAPKIKTELNKDIKFYVMPIFLEEGLLIFENK